MQLMHLLNVENSYTATHSEITLQQKILGLVDVIQKALVHKRGLMGGIQLVSQWEELYMRWHSILWSNPARADKHWAGGNSTLEKCAHPLIMETSKCTQIAALAFTASGSFCKDTASPTPAQPLPVIHDTSNYVQEVRRASNPPPTITNRSSCSKTTVREHRNIDHRLWRCNLIMRRLE